LLPKSYDKQCIQDVLYGDLIKILIGLHGSVLGLVEYQSPLYNNLKRQFDDAFELMKLNKVPFTEPSDNSGG